MPYNKPGHPGERVALLPRLLKVFYRVDLPVLPVVDKPADGKGASASDLTLLGFISREMIDRLMTDLERAYHEYDRIPDEVYLKARLTHDAIAALSRVEKVPVLEETGQQVAAWEEADTLAFIATYQKRFTNRPDAESSDEDFDQATQGIRGGKTAEISGPVEADGATGREWLGEIILSAIPWPLYCQDLQGNTLFYNRAFERDVLAREKLKNSIRLAEAFLLELTRSALALAYAEDREQESEAGTLTTTSQALDLIIRISYLQKNDRIVGYLYVFQEPGDDNLVPDLINRMVENEEGLEEITDDLEARLIYHMLARHGQNISHTARALRIKRSTLQNKMKRLRLDERFHRQIEGPIRRHRRTREELEAEAARSSDPSPDSADRFLTAYESDSATGESGPEWNRSHESRVNTTAIRADHPDIVSRSETSDQRIGMSEFVSELSQNRRSTGGADQRDSTARSHAHGTKKTGRTSKAIRKTASKPAPKSSAARKASGRTAKQTAAGRKAEKQSAHKKKSAAGTRKKSARKASRRAAAKSTAKAASGQRTGKKASKKKIVRKQGRPKSVAAHSNRRR